MRGTVLIIDDDALIRARFAELLRDDGFTVEQAADGAAGQRLAELTQPNVVLLDLGLPNHSGLEVLQELKQQHPTREIPVVIVGAYALLLIRDDARNSDWPLRAPFDLKALLEQVAGATHAGQTRLGALPPPP